MGVIAKAEQLKSEHNLDAVWIQVGAFMEMHGETAKQMSRAYGLAIWYRNGTPTVGVPVTHSSKWMEKTSELGLTVGVAFQHVSGYKLTRHVAGVMRGRQGTGQFSSTGNPKFLGEAAPPETRLGINQIFEIEIPGITTPTRTHRKICDGAYCEHESKVVLCIDSGTLKADQFLGQLVGDAVKAIYPHAW